MWISLHFGYYSTRYNVHFGESSSNTSCRGCFCSDWHIVESLVDIIRILFSDYLQLRYHDLYFSSKFGSHDGLDYSHLALLTPDICLFLNYQSKLY